MLHEISFTKTISKLITVRAWVLESSKLMCAAPANKTHLTSKISDKMMNKHTSLESTAKLHSKKCSDTAPSIT